MGRTLTPERQQLKEHAITLRKQGWTEQAIAVELSIPQQTVSGWLRSVFTDNATLGNTGKAWHITDNRKATNISKNLVTSTGGVHPQPLATLPKHAIDTRHEVTKNAMATISR